jgi:hypothetical protein
MARRTKDDDGEYTGSPERKHAYWWKTPIGERANVHDDLVGHANALWAAHAQMRFRDYVHAKIYRALPKMMESSSFAPARAALAAQGYGTAKLNVTKSIVDTAVAKLGKERPMPSAVTDDSDWSIKRRARKFTRFMKGKMQETDFERIAPLVLRDACLFGTGVIKVASAFGEICPERVWKEEILVDPREARKGKPRQLGQVKQYAREVLREMVMGWGLTPERCKEICAAIDRSDSSTHYRSEVDDDVPMGELDDQIDVYEWWHLPSSPEAEDGRHAIVIAGCTLLYEAWERPRFPFAFVHWTAPVKGFWGSGIVEELAHLQNQINRTIADIQKNLEIAGKLICFVRRGQGHNRQQMVGRGPFYVEHDGAKPEYVVPQAVNPQNLALLDKHIQWAYDLTGVSQMSAQSRNTLGAGASGVALDNFYDIQSERFAHVQAQYANFRLDCGELYIDAAYDIAESREEMDDGADEDGKPRAKPKPYTAKHVDRSAVERLDWDGVSLERDQFTLRLEAVNFLPDTRAGKIAAADALAAAGLIDRDVAGLMFDEPDIERVNRIKNAPYNNWERIMEEAADPDEPMPVVHSFLDLALGKKMAIAWLNRMEADKAPDSVIGRYRRLIDLIKATDGKAKAAEAAAMPPALPPGAPPMGGPPGMPPGGVVPPVPPEMLMPPGAEMPPIAA